ncbi:MAG: NAD-dependent epimerase/dehydratase family protein [Bradymonadaceae bacterium]
MERIVVFGATGRIGRYVVRRIAGERSREVVAARRWDSSPEVLEGSGATDLVVDLDEREAVRHAVTGATGVVHCAAPDTGHDSEEYMARSVEYVRRIASIAREEGAERVVVTSTAATAAAAIDRGGRADESDVYLPGSSRDPFLEGAYAVEQECFRQAADGQQICTINPSLVVGPETELPPRSSFPEVADDDPVDWVSPGRVATAHAQALRRGNPGERYLIGGTAGTVGGLYRAVERAGGRTTREGGWFSGGREPFRDRALIGEGRRLDCSKARSDLGLASR